MGKTGPFGCHSPVICCRRELLHVITLVFIKLGLHGGTANFDLLSLRAVSNNASGIPSGATGLVAR